MRVVDTQTVEWHYGPGHRDPGLALRDVFLGEPGEPGNYWLSLVKVVDTYDAPPHRHNFDQVRVVLEGAFNFGAQDQDEGSIGYFCEGTVYKQTARGPSLTLLLQCEGGSGSRYISQTEMKHAVQELTGAGGDFVHGRFVGPDPVTGEPTKKDSYEAIWEQVVGRRLEYPKPRYQSPVIVRPEAFGYLPMADSDGVYEKNLGVFNERKTGIGFWKLDPGAKFSLTDATRTLLFVKSGRVAVADHEVGAFFAVEVDANETVEVRHVDHDVEILVLRLPRP